MNNIYDWNEFLLKESFETEVKQLLLEELDLSTLSDKIKKYLKRGMTIGAITSILISSGISKSQAESLIKQNQTEISTQFSSEEVSEKFIKKQIDRLVDFGVTESSAHFFVTSLVDNNFNKDQIDDLIDEIIDNIQSKDFNKWISQLKKHVQTDEKFYTEYLKSTGKYDKGPNSKFTFNPLKFLKPVDSKLTGVKLLKQKNIIDKNDDAVDKKILNNWVKVSEEPTIEGSEVIFMKLVPTYEPVKGTMKDSGSGGKGGAGCRSNLQWGDT